MRTYKIPHNLDVYLAAIHLCEEYGSAKQAHSVIKQFVIDYKGIPFHRGLFIDFFTVRFVLVIDSIPVADSQGIGSFRC